MTDMKLREQIFLYLITILHIPITLFRALIAIVLLVDSWCDKVIDDFWGDVLNDIDND